MSAPLLEAKALSKCYGTGSVRAVENASFTIEPGETLGLVGESGSGKSTIARLLLRLEEPSGGTLCFDGDDWFGLSRAELRRRRRKMQIVFQDPSTSLDPRFTADEIVGEPLLALGGTSRSARKTVVRELLARVGLDPGVGSRYPHEFSGGERQRIAIARALAPQPKLIVCDEAVAALDVSIGAQIVNLFIEIQEQTGVSYLFISHDLDAVAALADRIAVLEGGRVVELAEAGEILSRPEHPATRALVQGRGHPGDSFPGGNHG